MVYATIADLVPRIRREVSDAERLQVEAALEDASLAIDIECPLSDEPTAQDLQVRKVVVCRMVVRAFSVAADAVGVGSLQTGAGPYQSSVNFSNPMGELYLTKADRRLLGCGRQQAHMIDLAPLDPTPSGLP